MHFETLRLGIALYVMGAAIGLWAIPGAPVSFGGVLGPSLAANLYTGAIFGAGWFILVGLHMRRASLALMAMVLAGGLGAGHFGAGEFALFLALLPLANIIQRDTSRPRSSGRIRLTRIKVTRPKPASRECTAPAPHPFSQSPDDLACLFDQIGEIR